MKVLLTGNSGFIGSNLTTELRQRNYEVFGLDRNEPATPPSKHYICDLCDANGVARILQEVQPDAVIHLAARVDIDPTAKIEGYKTNIEGTQVLMDAIKRLGTSPRLVVTSSQLVCRIGYVPKDPGDYCPDNLYGESKVKTEQIVRQCDGAGTIWCLVRPTTVWGPGMCAHYVRFLRMIEKGFYFHVTRKPLLKSFSYIKNICHQYIQLMEAPGEKIHRQVFYLADYSPLSLQGWSGLIQKELAARRIPTIPTALAITMARTGDLINNLGLRRFPFNSFHLKNILTEYVYDMEPTKRVCGPLPYTLEKAVHETMEWYKNGGKSAASNVANSH